VASVSPDVDDVLDVEPVELDVESVLEVLEVLVDVLAVLSVVRPSDASAEAMAAASGLTLFVPDEASDAVVVSPDVELLPTFWLFVR
jgi:hypothetical protein